MTLLLAVSPAGARAGAACRVMPAARLQALGEVYRMAEFRIFYTLAGPDALTQPADHDGNGVPDTVEDAARQLVAARRAYTELMGFVHPLQQPRYRATATTIDVNIMPVRTGSTGRAYDEVVNVRRGLDAPGGTCALRIDLDPRWTPANQTAGHELFHLFQNGYTMFKMSWLTEGTARWAEATLGGSAPPDVPLPGTPNARTALLASGHAAGGFWATLAAQLDPGGRLPSPGWLQALRYTNGTPVRGEARVQGAAFIRQVFEAMGPADAVAAQARGWPPYNWPEAGQKAAANDALAWAALMQVVRTAPTPGPQVAALLAFDAAQPLAGAP